MERVKDGRILRDGYWNITVRVPASTPFGRSPIADTREWATAADAMLNYTMGIKRTGEMSFPINYEEKTMKIFEGVVVKLNDQKQFSEVVQVVPPFVAADETAAKNAVLVDYAKANNLAGKDLYEFLKRYSGPNGTIPTWQTSFLEELLKFPDHLTGFTVVVRNFQGSY